MEWSGVGWIPLMNTIQSTCGADKCQSRINFPTMEWDECVHECGKLDRGKRGRFDKCDILRKFKFQTSNFLL